MIKILKFKIAYCFFLVSFVSLTQAQNAEYRDVIINEIMANPNPPIDDIPNKEYIEIYNRSNRVIRLNGWTLKDASTTIGVFSDSNIDKGEYAIVCKIGDESLFESFGKVLTVSKWPTLNNDKDSIIIRDADGQLIDAVYYKDTWYKDADKKKGGYSLELINPALNCSDDNNWIASDAVNGGTPGLKNSVENSKPDTIAPLITRLEISDPKTIQITFSKSIDVVTAENINLYDLTPSVKVTLVGFNAERNRADIHLAEELIKGQLYNLTVFGINDCEGNSLADTSLVVFLGESPKFNEILITEIMAKPSPSVGLPEEEYIEIYNNSGKAIDLQGITFKASTRLAVFENATLLSGEYAVVCSSDKISLFSQAPKVIGLDKFPALTDGGADLTLMNVEGEVLFQLSYSNAWYESPEKKNGGWSLEMLDLSQPCIAEGNWKESRSPNGGTPGIVNSVNGDLEDVKSIEAVAVEYHNLNHIQIVFSGKLNFNLKEDISIQTEPDLEVGNVNINPTSPNLLEIDFIDEIKQGEIYQITIDGVYDCVGKAIKSSLLQFGIPQLAQPGDIVINELLYDPKVDGVDFVELLNTSDKLLSTSDLIITREDPITHTIITNTSLEKVKKLIFPGDYIVLSSKGANIRSQYKTPGESVFADISGFPNYVNDGGIVGLYNSDNILLESFEYNPKMHLKVLKNTKGVSLERVNPKISADEPSNWNSASLSIGGATPGYQNSQFLQPVAKGELSVSPEVFSPDNDGFDDVLGISYQLDKADYVGSASIYTIEGIPVRTLFSQQTLSQEGFFTWNGLDNNDKKARTGIYVVVLELYNLKGKTDILRTKCVVASGRR